MMRRLLADRGPQLELFDRLATGEANYCILLIEAKSGLGKSHLLREFERRCPADVICVAVDFKGEQGLADAFSLLGAGLGMANLPQFSARVAHIVGPEQVVIARNVLIGKPEIQVALSAPDEEARRSRRVALTEAFFADLNALGRRSVFIFDTLNEAAPDAREWLLGLFLGHLRHCGNAAAVVAGQPPLEERTAWAARCEFIRLEGITEAEDWHTEFPTLSIETIHAYCVLFDGHPLQVMTALDKFVRAGQAVGGRGGGR